MCLILTELLSEKGTGEGTQQSTMGLQQTLLPQSLPTKPNQTSGRVSHSDRLEASLNHTKQDVKEYNIWKLRKLQSQTDPMN